MKWADNGGGDFEQPPAGTTVGRCIQIIDLGTQRGEYQGKANVRRQNIIGWELPNDLQSDGDYKGKPFRVSRFYTASLGKKANLRRDLEQWRGREFTEQELQGFDPQNILGKCCLLALTPNEKGKIKVTGVMALPKGMEVPGQVNPNLFFSLDAFDRKVFDSLSEGLRKIIEVSPEYQSNMRHMLGGGNAAGGDEYSGRPLDDGDDDIPF